MSGIFYRINIKKLLDFTSKYTENNSVKVTFGTVHVLHFQNDGEGLKSTMFGAMFSCVHSKVTIKTL